MKILIPISLLWMGGLSIEIPIWELFQFASIPRAAELYNTVGGTLLFIGPVVFGIIILTFGIYFSFRSYAEK
jgi:hypothetical protein